MVESRPLYRDTPLYKTLSNSHYNDKVAIITFKTAAESGFCAIGPSYDRTTRIPTKKTDNYYVMGLGTEPTLKSVKKGDDGKYMEYCVKLDNIEKAVLVSESPPKSKSKSPSKSALRSRSRTRSRSKSKGGRSKKYKTRKSHKKIKSNKK